MKTEFKAHPLMIFSGKTPLFLLFIVPIVRAVFWYILKGKTPTFSLAVWAGVVFVLVAGVLRMMSFRLIYCDNNFTINKGWLFKSSLSINKTSVSSIEIKQNPIEWLFRAKTLCINTEASQSKKSEFKIKLYNRDCETISRILYNCEKGGGNKIPPLKALLAAVFTSSAFTGLIIGVPIINNIGRLLGIALRERIFKEIGRISLKIETYFPPIARTITLIFLISYALSFIYRFFRYIRFIVINTADEKAVCSGLLVKSKVVFNRKNINVIKAEQNLLMLLFKRFSIRISLSGFETAGDRTYAIVPLCKEKEQKRILREDYNIKTAFCKAVTPTKKTATENRFMFWCILGIFIIPLLAVICFYIFPSFSGLILFITVIFLFLLVCRAYISREEYKTAKFSLSETLRAEGCKTFKKSLFYAQKEKISSITIRRIFTDKRHKSCRIILRIEARNRDKIRLKHLPFTETKREIDKAFNTNV